MNGSPDRTERGLNGFVGRNRMRVQRQYLILRELIRQPRVMGTLFPSSPALADEMACALSPSMMKSGILVELGAGTGPVTEGLLRRGVPPERLFVVEKSPALAECLSKRFPSVNVICCGAEELRSHIKGDEKIRAIISSLPFRSLPFDVGSAIMKEIEAALSPGGLFVQFTYALIGEMLHVPPTFKKVRSHLVLYNLPPAKVEVFRKPKRGERHREREEDGTAAAEAS
ncbi:MAG: methyltransferase domain-containing protein [Synergistaceae bacterium]|jgi:phospholipid N-methyltransferase|nr:methyltransferase domain-containing protein [Synergistaceae bacterium]